MNSVTIIGRLGADAELKSTSGGTALLTMSVAVNERKKTGDETTWFRVAVFGNRAEALGRLGLTRGTRVAVVGPVRASAYAGRDGQPRASLEVIARELELLGGGNPARVSTMRDQPQAEESSSSNEWADGDDLPF